MKGLFSLEKGRGSLGNESAVGMEGISQENSETDRTEKGRLTVAGRVCGLNKGAGCQTGLIKRSLFPPPSPLPLFLPVVSWVVGFCL